MLTPRQCSLFLVVGITLAALLMDLNGVFPGLYVLTFVVGIQLLRLRAAWRALLLLRLPLLRLGVGPDGARLLADAAARPLFWAVAVGGGALGLLVRRRAAPAAWRRGLALRGCVAGAPGRRPPSPVEHCPAADHQRKRSAAWASMIPASFAAEPLVVADLAAVGHDAVVHGQGPVEEGELAVVLLDATAASRCRSEDKSSKLRSSASGRATIGGWRGWRGSGGPGECGGGLFGGVSGERGRGKRRELVRRRPADTLRREPAEPGDRRSASAVRRPLRDHALYIRQSDVQSKSVAPSFGTFMSSLLAASKTSHGLLQGRDLGPHLALDRVVWVVALHDHRRKSRLRPCVVQVLRRPFATST